MEKVFFSDLTREDIDNLRSLTLLDEINLYFPDLASFDQFFSHIPFPRVTRIVIGERVDIIIIIEDSRIMLSQRFDDTTNTRKIKDQLDRLPPEYPLFFSGNISYHPSIVFPQSGRQVYTHFGFYLTERSFQILSQAELGLVNPFLPPGPGNPRLRDRLHVLRHRFIQGSPLGQLVAIYLYLHQRRIVEPDEFVPNTELLPLMPSQSQLRMSDITPFMDLNVEIALTVQGNPTLDDVGQMHPPGENFEEDWDEELLDGTFIVYDQIPPEGAMIYLSTGERILMTHSPLT